MKKKFILVLTLVAIFTVLFAISVSADEVVESWDASATESDSVTAYLYNDSEKEGYYTLTVSGTGAMADSTAEAAPWLSLYADKITLVTVENGITSIGSNCFEGCVALTRAFISDTVTAMGENAFAGCTALTAYAEANEQPSGWSEGWNPLDCPVEWNYKNVMQGEIFKFKGYSFGMGSSMAFGYDINYEAIDEYEALTGKDLSIGVAFASFELLNGANPIDNEGNIITLSQGRVAGRALDNYRFSAYDFMLTGITGELQDHSVVISAYIYDGSKTRFIQENGISDTVTGVTYNEIYAKESIPISTAADLEKIRENPEGMYHLTNDIDLESNRWTPVPEFYGIFDGNGYKISNMKLKVYWANGGFIANNYGTVKNLSFENTDAYFETPIDETSCAIIAGVNYGEIINCHTYGGQIKYYAESQRCDDSAGYGDLFIGNIAGINDGGLISGCSAKVGISGEHRACNYKSCTCIGGLVARQLGEGTITNCNAELSIYAKSTSPNENYRNEAHYRLGGLVGEIVNGKIEKSYANCSISNDYGSVYDKGQGISGGLIGNMYGGTIDQCFSKGSISLSDKRTSSVVGGFVGRISGESFITNSYTNTSVYCTGRSSFYHLGSFCGYMPSGEIKNCYATGSISYNNVYGVETGTFTARFHGGTIRNCITTLTGAFVGSEGGTKENNANANDYTLEELKSKSLVYGTLKFDRKIWVVDGENMPILAWQNESEK